MFRTSIRRKIVGIAMGLVILMVATSVLSMVMASRVGHLLDELSNKYIQAYGHLARANIQSLERSLALRRMAMAKMQSPPDEASYTERLHIYQQSENKIEEEAGAARKLIASIIADVSTASDDVALTRIDTNIDNAVNDLNRHLNQESDQLLSQLEAKDLPKPDARWRALMRSATNSIRNSIKYAPRCWVRLMPARLWCCATSTMQS